MVSLGRYHASAFLPPCFTAHLNSELPQRSDRDPGNGSEVIGGDNRADLGATDASHALGVEKTVSRRICVVRVHAIMYVCMCVCACVCV